MVASARTLAEANQLARRTNKISEAARLYEQVPNKSMDLSPEQEAKSIARASRIFEARKLARIGQIEAAMKLLAASETRVTRADVEALYQRHLKSEQTALAAVANRRARKEISPANRIVAPAKKPAAKVRTSASERTGTAGRSLVKK